MSASEPLLRAVHITKSYGDVIANNNVTFDLRAGEIHAVLGENGAGKSTFMKVLYGLELPDDGFVELRGKPLALHAPSLLPLLGGRRCAVSSSPCASARCLASQASRATANARSPRRSPGREGE